jgi:hypothetical protein
MKPRNLIVPLAAGAAFASHPVPLSLHAAMEIAQQEIVRRGLAGAYHASAFYAGADRHAEGAAFAVIVCPQAAVDSVAKRAGALPRLKLLIHEDGRTTLQPIPARIRVHS